MADLDRACDRTGRLLEFLADIGTSEAVFALLFTARTCPERRFEASLEGVAYSSLNFSNYTQPTLLNIKI
jgi:hypothetical protein